MRGPHSRSCASAGKARNRGVTADSRAGYERNPAHAWRSISRIPPIAKGPRLDEIRERRWGLQRISSRRLTAPGE
ncbi:hypothetical protein ppKF707_5425 [Metapseudomonas furukawaii]|uniref:Uncharacterized protein n=1 Tax=Metapseudomonas furukawaii TaxID=1149133 RepID=A0AAD1C5Q6_METFU|nr:hypothetical protein ppKF707_5425 [Pseudomonas furukawaii]BAU77360.1 hypothetical protein KF707C_56720 [Pseudomonas furukawaii]